MDGLSFDVWDTVLCHARTSGNVADRRATLLSSRTGVQHAAASAALSVRLPQESAGAAAGTIGLSVLERTRLALHALGDPPCDSDTLAVELSEAGSAHVIGVPGVGTVLASIGRLPRVIVSNTRWTSGATLRRLIDETLARDVFDGGAFSDETGWAKPNPRLFEEAWRDLRVAPEATVHIGDRVKRDVLGARACGARSIVCRVVRRRRERGDGSADGILYDYEGFDALLQLLQGRDTPSGWRVAGEGLSVWGPPVVGRVKRVRCPDDEVEDGSIVLLRNSAPEFLPFFRHAAAVIAEAGGYGSHAAQTAPLCDTPCVVGLDRMGDAVQDGMLALVDPTRGNVLIPVNRG